MQREIFLKIDLTASSPIHSSVHSVCRYPETRFENKKDGMKWTKHCFL